MIMHNGGAGSDDITPTPIFLFLKVTGQQGHRRWPHSTHVSKQTGAKREQRKVPTCEWQPVRTSDSHLADLGITSPRVVWPNKLGSLISE